MRFFVIDLATVVGVDVFSLKSVMCSVQPIDGPLALAVCCHVVILLYRVGGPNPGGVASGAVVDEF